MVRRESNPLYKIIVLGDGGVGKTALTIQLCLNHFVETYDPTIEDSYRKQVVIDAQPATLEVLDTAGQEEYTALRDQWVRDGEGFLLVYSITSRSSFLRIRNYYEQIERVKDKDPFALVLVGNKSDRTSERQVSQSEGEELARSLGPFVHFFESSAKHNVNIEQAFFQCARICRHLREGVSQEELVAAYNNNNKSPNSMDRRADGLKRTPSENYHLHGPGPEVNSNNMPSHQFNNRYAIGQGNGHAGNAADGSHFSRGRRRSDGTGDGGPGGASGGSPADNSKRRKSDKKAKCMVM